MTENPSETLREVVKWHETESFSLRAVAFRHDPADTEAVADLVNRADQHAAFASALTRAAEVVEKIEGLRADAARYRYLRESRSYHYGMSMVEPAPAEWGIEWQYQQFQPGEQLETIDSLIDAEIAAALTPKAEGGDHG